MRVGICEWTTFPASFEDELAAYRAAGAGAIGILEFKLDGVDDVRGKLRESGLAASACLPAAGSVLPSPLIPGPEEPEVESICASVVRSLVEAGYDGWFDVEVMSDDGRFDEAFPDSLWALPTDEIARRPVEAVHSL
jgi:hypothetical protein